MQIDNKICLPANVAFIICMLFLLGCSDDLGTKDIKTKSIDGIGETLCMVIYPNPASETLHIQSRFEITEIHLINMSGQVVYSSLAAVMLIHEIDVNSFSNGTYVVHAKTTGGIFTTIVQIIK